MDTSITSVTDPSGLKWWTFKVVGISAEFGYNIMILYLDSTVKTVPVSYAVATVKLLKTCKLSVELQYYLPFFDEYTYQ